MRTVADLNHTIKWIAALSGALAALSVCGCFQRKACTDCMVLVGDSITANWQGLTTGRELAGLKIVNRGIPSDVTAHMLTRFDKDVTRIRPRVVVVLGGINDFERVPLSSTEQNLKAMAERADRNNIRVVLATLPPVGLSAGERDPNASILAQDAGRDKIRTLNDWIKDFAARKQYTVVDYHSALTDERGFYLKGLTSDGIHPSAQGYARMERLLSEAIRSAPQGGK